MSSVSFDSVQNSLSDVYKDISLQNKFLHHTPSSNLRYAACSTHDVFPGNPNNITTTFH